MKIRIFTLLILLTGTVASAQKSYEKGYVIDNNNNRIECLIRNEHWMNNPESFVYKTEDQQEHKALAAEVKAFQVYGYPKYERHYVNFANTVADVSQGEVHGRTQGYVWLKVEIGGDPSLYYYENGPIKKFFYKLSADSLPVVMQLSAQAENGRIDYNINYKNQLNMLAKDCQSMVRDSLKRLKYNANDIGRTIIRISDCHKVAYTDYRHMGKAKILAVGLTLTAGLDLSNAKTDQRSRTFDGIFATSFDSKAGLSFGAELDLHSQLYVRRWHLLLIPSYGSYSSEKQVNQDYAMDIKVNHLDVALGLRYFLFEKGKTGIFADALFVGISKQFSSELKAYAQFLSYGKDYPLYSFDNLSTAKSFALGAGVQHGRIGASVRYYLPANMLSEDGSGWNVKFSRINALIRFSLF